MIISYEDIREICNRHKIIDLYFYRNIPPKKLKNALESLKIPEASEVIALYDNTVFGSCKNGLAICSDGLYWNDDSIGQNSILWDDIDSINFSTKGSYLTINNFYNINIYCIGYNKKLAKFLLDIKNEIDKKDKNTPELKRNEDKIDIVQGNQPKNKLNNINDASLDQLLALPYFTSERAEKILSERKNNVIFTSLDDIIDILNLKPHEAETLKEYLSFETSNLNKNTADHEAVKKSEEIINDNINTPIKGRIVDF